MRIVADAIKQVKAQPIPANEKKIKSKKIITKEREMLSTAEYATTKIANAVINSTLPNFDLKINENVGVRKALLLGPLFFVDPRIRDSNYVRRFSLAFYNAIRQQSIQKKKYPVPLELQNAVHLFHEQLFANGIIEVDIAASPLERQAIATQDEFAELELLLESVMQPEDFLDQLLQQQPQQQLQQQQPLPPDYE